MFWWGFLETLVQNLDQNPAQSKEWSDANGVKMLGNKSFCFNQHKPYKLTQTLNLQHLKTKKLNYCSPELNKKLLAIFLVQSLSKTILRCVAKNLCNKIYVFINFAGTEVNKAKESIVLKLRVSCTKVPTGNQRTAIEAERHKSVLVDYVGYM